MPAPRDTSLSREKPDTALRVLVSDAQSKRGAEVVRELREGGLRPHHVHWLAALPAIDEEWSQVAVVGLPDDPSSQAATEWLRQASSAGLRPVCFGSGASQWPLRDRCRILLAGATRILESADLGFLAALTRLVRERVAADSLQRAEQRELRELMAKVGIVGQSPAMQGIFRWVRRISRLSDLPVLLLGETGTGKELLARAIRLLDPKRSRGPFVALNCNALSESLAESELFGHRSGAFTGAMRDRKGLFRAAQGGVLLLDEIGDLAPPLQGKLLRVLQESAVLGLGEDTEAPIDVRVVAATNRDLEKMVRNGSFREDLYQRMSLLAVQVPPLRERPEDVRPLAEHFIRKHAALCGVAPQPVSDDFLEAVQLCGLPGNARQLENLIRAALLKLEENSPVDLATLPAGFWRLAAEDEMKVDTAPLSAAAATPQTLPASIRAQFLSGEEATLASRLRQYERVLLREALHKSRGNQSRAARLLGVTPRSIYNKLRKHKLIA